MMMPPRPPGSAPSRGRDADLDDARRDDEDADVYPRRRRRGREDRRGGRHDSLRRCQWPQQSLELGCYEGNLLTSCAPAVQPEPPAHHVFQGSCAAGPAPRVDRRAVPEGRIREPPRRNQVRQPGQRVEGGGAGGPGVRVARAPPPQGRAAPGADGFVRRYPRDAHVATGDAHREVPAVQRGHRGQLRASHGLRPRVLQGALRVPTRNSGVSASGPPRPDPCPSRDPAVSRPPPAPSRA